MSGFKDLKVWQRSKGLAVLIYRLTQKGPFTRDYGFRDQIRRAAVSVPSNMNDFLMNKKRLKQQPITYYPWPITLFINTGE